MKVVTSYFSENFGFTFPDACIEVEEVASRRNGTFHSQNGNVNTMVRIRVWANEAAKNEGRQPVEQTEKLVNLETELVNTIHTTALEVLFPEAEIS